MSRPLQCLKLNGNIESTKIFRPICTSDNLTDRTSIDITEKIECKKLNEHYVYRCYDFRMTNALEALSFDDSPPHSTKLENNQINVKNFIREETHVSKDLIFSKFINKTNESLKQTPQVYRRCFSLDSNGSIFKNTHVPKKTYHVPKKCDILKSKIPLNIKESLENSDNKPILNNNWKEKLTDECIENNDMSIDIKEKDTGSVLPKHYVKENGVADHSLPDAYDNMVVPIILINDDIVDNDNELNSTSPATIDEETLNIQSEDEVHSDRFLSPEMQIHWNSNTIMMLPEIRRVKRDNRRDGTGSSTFANDKYYKMYPIHDGIIPIAASAEFQKLILSIDDIGGDV